MRRLTRILPLFLLGFATFALAQDGGGTAAPPLPNGQSLTPLAPPGASFVPLNPHLADDPSFTAGQAVTSVLSPDGNTLLVLTSGYNLQDFASGPQAGRRNPADSREYVFVFDVSGSAPHQAQALQVPNTYSGIAFSPDGQRFYVSGGDDDNVHVFARGDGGQWAEQGAPVPLGHTRRPGRQSTQPGAVGAGGRAEVVAGAKPEAAGLAVSADGRTLVVADYENDAITVLHSGADGWAISAELDLRPGKSDPAQAGIAGGEFPFWVAIRGNDTAYVSSVRDRQVVVVSLAGALPAVVARIAVPGQPNKMILNHNGSRLYVAQDNADAVAVISTESNRVLSEIPVVAPPALFSDPHHLFGINPNSLALSTDEQILYVTNGGENAVAVVRLSDNDDGGAGTGQVSGLIPTGWYPNSVTVSHDGRTLYVVNGMSDAGPNPGNLRGLTSAKHLAAASANQYILQLDKAGFQSFPVPSSTALLTLTHQVLENDHYLDRMTPEQVALFAGLRQRIHHVIYIIKENRTYDQVLGDLKPGDGVADLTEFPEANTPNFHGLARDFVTLDNFDCAGEVSGDGWPWSTSARTTDVDEKEIAPNYANRGLSYDTEGENRGVNLAAAKRADPDLLPGTANVAAPDGEEDGHDEVGQGFLWDAALRAGLSVRDYGFWVDGEYNQNSPNAIPELPDPAPSHTVVAISTSPSLSPYTDPYFRGFDQSFPDYYRFKEWEREFDKYAANGNLPNLELVRLEHDHFGNFGSAIDGLRTPELQIADDDYAVGLLVAKVAHSRYAHDTLIFVIEDDAQNGADHVDAHRSPAFILGPYVKHHVVVSESYNTVSMLRTIEEVLGLGPLNLHDASATPMSAVFDLSQSRWSYNATPSSYLQSSTLPIPHQGAALAPTHDGAWWAHATAGMDFSIADHLDSTRFNQILWEGLKQEQ